LPSLNLVFSSVTQDVISHMPSWQKERRIAFFGHDIKEIIRILFKVDLPLFHHSGHLFTLPLGSSEASP
jgi:hypothetical protein